ncbi:MAG: hypothetical protein AB7F86_02440 [Bdellovibrionales bacterium]
MNLATLISVALILSQSISQAETIYCPKVEVTDISLGEWLNGVHADIDVGNFYGIYGQGDFGLELSSDRISAIVAPLQFDRQTECAQTTKNTQPGVTKHVFHCQREIGGQKVGFFSALSYNRLESTGFYLGEITDATGTKSFRFDFSNCY